MTINITIGRKEISTPMFTCGGGGFDGCAGAECRQCLTPVKHEHRVEAPPISTATAQGVKRGGYNFADGIPTGTYYRILEETGIDARFPFMAAPDYPGTYSIPDALPGYLHCLAVDIEMGVVRTKYPQGDAEFVCWMAWWTGYAIRNYGLKAAIHFD